MGQRRVSVRGGDRLFRARAVEGQGHRRLVVQPMRREQAQLALGAVRLDLDK